MRDCDERETRLLYQGFCPACEKARLLEGPHGGLCVNVLCANCGAKWNVGPVTCQFLEFSEPAMEDAHAN